MLSGTRRARPTPAVARAVDIAHAPTAGWHGRQMRLEAWTPVLARPRQGDPSGPAPDRDYDVQIGLANGVVLSGLDRDERQFMGSLEGGRLVTAAEARRFTRALARLADAGLLRDDEVPVPTTFMGAVALATRTPLDGLIKQACEATRLSVHPVGEAPQHAVEVVCFVGAPDARHALRLMRNETRHVLVACDEAGVWVSHVVTIGVTACSRCRDVALTRADAAWPYLAAQLSGGWADSRGVIPQLPAGPAAAVRVAARLASWFAHGEAGIGERIGPDAAVTEARLAPETHCGCGAAGPVGDEVAARRTRI